MRPETVFTSTRGGGGGGGGGFWVQEKLYSTTRVVVGHLIFSLATDHDGERLAIDQDR